MCGSISIFLNGRAVTVASGSSVAAALLGAGVVGFRRSVVGEWRGPLCGMGICFECRVTIDGVAHCRSCQVRCWEGMEVETTGQRVQGDPRGPGGPPHGGDSAELNRAEFSRAELSRAELSGAELNR